MSFHPVIVDIVFIIIAIVFLYFVGISLFYFFFIIVSLVGLYRHAGRSTYAGYKTIRRSAGSLPISVLVPAHNEEKTIVESVRALLQLDYPEYEVIVINDGSSDNTLGVLVDEYQLEPVDWVIRQEIDRETGEVLIETKPTRGVYISTVTSQYRNLLVIDKEKGGKADALNAGLLASKYPLFCTVDADSILEADCLLKLVKPFMEHPAEMVANGGIIRIANGCRIENSRILEIKLPSKALPMFQVVEYLRAFLGGRLAKSYLHCLMIISGVFSLFKKEVVIKEGGYKADSIVEDMDLVMRLHRSLLEEKKKYRISFIPEPIAWTQVPSTLRDLAKQRFRWQRGLLRTLWEHKYMTLNPHYRMIGLLGMPFYSFFEAVGPLVEIAGYLTIPVLYLLGMLNFELLLFFFLLAVVVGTLLNLLALFLLEFSQRRYPRWQDTIKLIVFSILDNFGYRQLTMLWRLRAIFYHPRKRDWGDIGRTVFGKEEETAPERAVSATGGRPQG